MMKVYEERLKRHIIDGERIGLEEQLELARQQYPPSYHQTSCIDGMKVVGELFGRANAAAICTAIS